ncbi:NAD/NADP octopine/nopaline dehydrogenase family protein [Glutamicibacter mysorens]
MRPIDCRTPWAAHHPWNAPEVYCVPRPEWNYFTEDIPFGLVIWNSLAQQIGLSLPLTDSFIKLSGIICGTDFEDSGRTADILGLEGLDAQAIRTAFLQGTVPLVTS